jgi:hypothetical protein
VTPWSYSRAWYRRRNEIERLFRRLKGFRRIFTDDGVDWGVPVLTSEISYLRIRCHPRNFDENGREIVCRVYTDCRLHHQDGGESKE